MYFTCSLDWRRSGRQRTPAQDNLTISGILRYAGEIRVRERWHCGNQTRRVDKRQSRLPQFVFSTAVNKPMCVGEVNSTEMQIWYRVRSWGVWSWSGGAVAGWTRREGGSHVWSWSGGAVAGWTRRGVARMYGAGAEVL